MRVVTGLCCLLAATGAVAGERKEVKDVKKPAPVRPANGIRTPGVQIPFASLTSELAYDFDAPAPWIGTTDSVWIPAKTSLLRVDSKAKENKFGDPVAGLKNPCAGMVTAFNSLWIPNCGDGSVVRAEARSGKTTATLNAGAGTARPGIAATADSVWTFTDTRGTVSRIDPVQNVVVAEFRVFPDCNTLTFGETALWLTCPAENKVLRIDPSTNLVDKTIDVSERPVGLAIGETSVWVLCEKEGKIDRIDPKTSKVTKTIELGAPATAGTISFGEGAVWVSMTGFPITRIDAATEKVLQQFWGEGAGVVHAALGSVWLADSQAGKIRKFDPKRIAATLAE
jgi:virginiamycin B lyase